ncbi:flagellar basal body rod protein FlgB [Geobacter sp. SVR]|uniref:flagellar basal body rod protein FlgB n=1 Tax=Geobacter sp. SVR TaxID=2495594 RepID=UPI00143EFFBB|nr:flagellar basal body rod protein FlgB [Geobacter sp. SVR]BCS55831.1 flagellar basal body rod protein FlgB [Geobacter sp. SVR]GCF83835.1 flagellar basal body rod protein FlgB [Geobacter sp. SVR]
MSVDSLFGTTIQVLSKGIDLRAKNQNLISSNIANAETPNYVPKALSFESELQGALKSGAKGARTPAHSRHIPLKTAASSIQAVTGRIVETPAKTPGKDGNAVELENEMSKMAENQIMYNASVQLLSQKFNGLRNALKESK